MPNGIKNRRACFLRRRQRDPRKYYCDLLIAFFLEPFRSCALCPPDVGLLPCCLFLLSQTSGVYYSIEKGFVNTPKIISDLKDFARHSRAAFATKRLNADPRNALPATDSAHCTLHQRPKKTKEHAVSCRHPLSPCHV